MKGWIDIGKVKLIYERLDWYMKVWIDIGKVVLI